MRLLVSVRSAAEASAALGGGADIIDAKEPSAGALGPVDLRTLAAIHSTVGHAREVSAALGDVSDEAAVERDARAFTEAGAAFVKIGFAGIDNATRVRGLIKRAVGVSRRVVVVAYADASDSIAPAALLDCAARAGAQGVLMDTTDKTGPGLPALIDRRALAAWVASAHDRGLLVALAGRLSAGDLELVRDAGADIAGIRGAACTGGRNGVVSTERVSRLHAVCIEQALRIPNPESRIPNP